MRPEDGYCSDITAEMSPGVNKPMAEANTPARSKPISHPTADGNKHGEAECVAGEHSLHAQGRYMRSACAMAGTAVLRIVVSSDFHEERDCHQPSGEGRLVNASAVMDSRGAGSSRRPHGAGGKDWTPAPPLARSALTPVSTGLAAPSGFL